MNRKNIIGREYGMLKVLSFDHKDCWRQLYYRCLCKCGNITIVRTKSLTSGNTKSCGCLIKSREKTYRQKNKRLYKIWIGMRNRCNNPNNPCYNRYGGRGISVCYEWDADFEEFCKWSLSHGYNAFLSLDRKDNNLGYNPSNCRWATAQEQADNKRSNILITINGTTMDLQQWCNHYSINRSTVNTRVNICGWSYIDAITTPVRAHKQYKQRHVGEQPIRSCV